MRLSFIPLLLLIIPVLEIGVFILVGENIGVMKTLLLILVTAVIGTMLLRHQGFQIISNINQATSRGEIPGEELGHGAMILVAGVLLLTPGFVTDTIGFCLFVPQIRRGIWRLIRSHVHVVAGSASSYSNRGGGAYSREEGVVDLEPDEYYETSDKDYDKTDKKGRIEETPNQKRNDKNSPWA